MMAFLRFFAGTPQRFLTSAAVFAGLVIFSVLFPGAIGRAINGLFGELLPLLYWAVIFGLVIAGYGVVFRGLRTKGKGGKS